MKADLVLSPQSERLTTLAATANREHELTFGSAVEALKHAILCGEALIEARQTVPEGQWFKWGQEHLDKNMAPRIMSVYVRLATHKEHLVRPQGPSSIGGAVSYLNQLGAGLPHDRNGQRPSFDVTEARRLRDQGLSYLKIGEILGVSYTAIRHQLVPADAKQAQRNAARRKAERRALAAKQRDEAVKRAGGSPAEAYALLRRCALKIDQAMLDAQDAEQREQLRISLALTHRAEDAIVRALRIGRQS